MAHDECRATQRFLYAGQNLCYRSSSDNFEEISQAVEACIQMWYNEKKSTTQQNIDVCCDTENQQTGHFTTMVHERQKGIGCAASRFTNDGAHITLIACNYAFTNMLQLPVYTSGPPASGCTSGNNPEFSALCSVKENYEINKIW